MEKVVALRTDEQTDAPEENDDAALNSHEAHQLPRRGGLLRLLMVIVILAAAAAVTWPWLAERWTHLAIDDSRVSANLIAVSSEVSGRITAVPVIAGDTVTKGQLLASIDEEPVLLELQALEARITGVETQQQQLRAQQEMIRRRWAQSLALPARRSAPPRRRTR